MNHNLARFALLLIVPASSAFAAGDPVLNTMQRELDRSFTVLRREEPVGLYFLQYEITDERQVICSACLGTITNWTDERSCYLDVDTRVGSPRLDNTHEIRGGSDQEYWGGRRLRVPIDGDPDAIRAIIWAETDRSFKLAQERFTKVVNERQVKVVESDTSPDFSASPAVRYEGPVPQLHPEDTIWSGLARRLSDRFRPYSWIYNSEVTFRVSLTTRYLVNSDGSRIRHSSVRYTLRFYASTMAEDGMELYLSQPYHATASNGLPEEEELRDSIDSLINRLEELRTAPLVEPYTGPAILMNQACGVFFHEIFGHRIEGHRQKSESEGQTFTKKVGERILPEFMSVYDDPTMTTFGGRDLNGHYQYDNEGVAAQRVVVVENGVLKGFLMSRSPIAGYPGSNGHGRRQYGYDVVSRQGVLYVKSDHTVSLAELRAALRDECRRQNKPYGLIFHDISGGFTMTGRSGVQTFKVLPLYVKRVYVDGRPDEVVRGVDIVGTPLASFSKITLTGDDYAVFNGTCGAESGWIPVSAIAPSILVSEIEVEKKSKGQDRPPILPAPDCPR